MTAPDLAAIEARANAAHAGPWKASTHDADEGRIESEDGKMIIYAEGGHDHADAQFTAHARTDIPDLIAEVKRLRAALLTEADVMDIRSGANYAAGEGDTELADRIDRIVDKLETLPNTPPHA